MEGSPGNLGQKRRMALEKELVEKYLLVIYSHLLRMFGGLEGKGGPGLSSKDVK